VKASFRLAQDGVYRCDGFQEFFWQTHGFGTRNASPNADVTLRQVHSGRVFNARGTEDRAEEGDALVTDEIARSIGVRTADCVPILLLDAATRCVGAVHAGWRGTAARIVERAIERMRADFGTDAAHIYAAVGPCIRACCYEVGSDIAEQFEAATRKANAQGDRCFLNLAEANLRQMRAAGVMDQRIFDCGLCTACQSAQFFSYRREPTNPGRMTTSISRLA